MHIYRLYRAVRMRPRVDVPRLRQSFDSIYITVCPKFSARARLAQDLRGRPKLRMRRGAAGGGLGVTRRRGSPPPSRARQCRKARTRVGCRETVLRRRARHMGLVCPQPTWQPQQYSTVPTSVRYQISMYVDLSKMYIAMGEYMNA